MARTTIYLSGYLSNITSNQTLYTVPVGKIAKIRFKTGSKDSTNNNNLNEVLTSSGSSVTIFDNEFNNAVWTSPTTVISETVKLVAGNQLLLKAISHTTSANGTGVVLSKMQNQLLTLQLQGSVVNSILNYDDAFRYLFGGATLTETGTSLKYLIPDEIILTEGETVAINIVGSTDTKKANYDFTVIEDDANVT